jgi:hypothetical protein
MKLDMARPGPSISGIGIGTRKEREFDPAGEGNQSAEKRRNGKNMHSEETEKGPFH